ncbi:hypothetical protein CPC08DRAFT_708665 [Agrocybe pediades]|nr:hypothetical protein CPC08DRAFT_708665 [Agrocybe pediades]
MRSVLRRGKIDMHDLICRGKFGLDALINCVKHLVVKRGVSEGPFEGKLSAFDIESLIPTGPRRRKWEKL